MALCICVCVCVHAHTLKLLQTCLTRYDSMDCSLPASSVHGISPARTLEWVAMTFSRVSSQPRDQICVSYVSCLGRHVLYHQRHLGSPIDGYLQLKEMQDTESENVKVCISLQIYLTQSLEFPEELSEHSFSIKMTSGKYHAGNTGSNPLNFQFVLFNLHPSCSGHTKRNSKGKQAIEWKPLNNDRSACFLAPWDLPSTEQLERTFLKHKSVLLLEPHI